MDGWGGGPGVGQRLSAEEVRMQQQAIIAGENRGCSIIQSHVIF